MSQRRSPLRILTQHFLRRFLDNDLLLSASDRHETLSVAFGALLSVSVFVTVFLTMKYLSQFIQLPGPTAMSALSDRFFLIALSMTITALVTLLLWDALGMEPRDGAILGPLPVRTSTMAKAKLLAVLLFATVFSVVFNAATSVIYPLLMTDHLGLSTVALLRIVTAHAVSTMSAGSFAFLVVFGTRGLLQAIVSERWFARISSLVQTALIVLVVSALLLLPVVTADVSRDWLRADASRAWRAMPPLWFLGLYETLEGHAIVDATIVVPSRLSLPPRIRAQNDATAALYRRYDTVFRESARTALIALLISLGSALACYTWNSRRLPLPTTWRPVSSRIRPILTRCAQLVLVRRSAARAGFFFTLQVLTRSTPHRVAMSTALAFGLSASFVMVSASLSGSSEAVRSGALPQIGLLAAQVAVIAALLGGFSHAVRLTAEPPANWTFKMGWQGDQRSFVTGSKRAGMVALIVLPLVAFFPGYLALVGLQVAMTHAAICGLAALGILEALFLGFKRLPFASPYVPLRNPKLWWPASFGALFVVPPGFAAIERAALASRQATIGLVAVLVSIVTVVAYSSKRQDWSGAAEFVFEEFPATPTQRLGLRDRVLG